MAIYHLSAQLISRSTGRSSVGAAAYRAAERIVDERLGRVFDFTGKGADLLHSAVLLPTGAPEWMGDRTRLWNAVEQGEKRKDAQLAREVNIALPRELSYAQNIALARAFVQRTFVDRGMVADLAVHRGHSDGEDQPHLHVMLTLRRLEGEGFGRKERTWNDKALLKAWRVEWEAVCNRHLARAERDVQIDHRTLAAQGIDLQPQHKRGPSGSGGVGADPRHTDKALEHAHIAWFNGERLRYRPEIAVDALMQQRSTVTHQDIARFVHRHTVDNAQFQAVYARVRHAPQWRVVGKDVHGNERLTDKAVYQREAQMINEAQHIQTRSGHTVEARTAHKTARRYGLSAAQRRVYDHILAARDLACVTGIAGSGKSYVLGAAVSVWQAQRYHVQGVTLSGVVADRLSEEAGMPCETVARTLYRWSEGQARLDERSVVVVDEAGLLGSRQMAAIVHEVNQAGAKLVCVGDPEQLQPIEAGAAFRAIAERVGVVGLTEVRRQKTRWQRTATEALAHGQTHAALSTYQARGRIHSVASQHEAEANVIAGWTASVRRYGLDESLMLAYRRDEVARLNEAAHAQRLADGALGPEVAVQTARGVRHFSVGDRVMFLRNERHVLHVKNGTVGVIEAIKEAELTIAVDQGSEAVGLTINISRYDALDYGYAMTVHKAQGVTVESVHVLANPLFDRHVTYVALSRHRRAVSLHIPEAAFRGQGQPWMSTLSRARAKDTSLDYAQTRGFAAARTDGHPLNVSTRRAPRLNVAHEPVRTYASVEALSTVMGLAVHPGPNARSPLIEAKTDALKITPQNFRGFAQSKPVRAPATGQYWGQVHLQATGQTYHLMGQPTHAQAVLLAAHQCSDQLTQFQQPMQLMNPPEWARGAEGVMAVPRTPRAREAVRALWGDLRGFEASMGAIPRLELEKPAQGLYRGLVEVEGQRYGLMHTDQGDALLIDSAQTEALTPGTRLEVRSGLSRDGQSRSMQVKDVGRERGWEIER